MIVKWKKTVWKTKMIRLIYNYINLFGDEGVVQN